MTTTFPVNANFLGTVSAPLFISNQVLIAPVAAGTASTLTVGSASATYLSVSASITSPTLYASTLSASICSLSVASVSSLSGAYGSFTQANISTVSCFSLSGTYGSINSLFTGTHLYSSLSGVYSSVSAVSSCGTLIAGFGTLGSLTFGSYIGVNIAPSYPLDVAGTARITGNTIFANMQNAGSLSAYTSFGIGAGGSIASTAAVNLNAGSLGTPYVNFDQYGVNNASIGLDPSDSGKFKILVNGSGTFSNSAARLTITSTGSVGINTASPAYTLDVSGGGARVTGDITVGTGVYASGPAGGVHMFPWTDYNTYFDFQGTNSGIIRTAGNARIYITGSTTSTTGFVGINNSAPSYQFDVTGSARFTTGVTCPARRDYRRYGFVSASGSGVVAASFSTLIADNLGSTYVTYTADTTNGDSILINTAGIYSIVANMTNNSTSETICIDKNTSGTVAYGGGASGSMLAWNAKGTNYECGLSFVGYFAAADVIRIKNGTPANNLSSTPCTLTLTFIV